MLERKSACLFGVTGDVAVPQLRQKQLKRLREAIQHANIGAKRRQTLFVEERGV